MRPLSPQFKGTMKAVTSAATVGMAMGAYALPQVTHEAPSLWPDRGPSTGQVLHSDAKAPNVPSWNKSLGKQFEGYSNIATKPKNHIPSSVVAVDQWSKPHTMSLDEAFNRTETKSKHDNVWTVGYR